MEDQELIESFVSESTDLIDDVEPLFIKLEKKANANEPADVDTVNKIFRLFHSMKGSAAFLNLNNIAELTHHAETLLDEFRKNPELRMSAYYLEVQLQAIDAIRAMLDSVSSTGSDNGTEELKEMVVKKLIEAFKKAQGGETGMVGTETAAEPQTAMPEKNVTPVHEEDDIKAMITAEGDMNFVSEGGEMLLQAEDLLLRLEKTEGDGLKKDMVEEAFRLLHNFKGSCGILQLSDLAKLSHAAENILDGMRGGKIEINNQNIEILLQAVDSLSGGVKSLTADENQGVIQSCDLMVEFLNEISGASPLTNVKDAIPTDMKAKAKQKSSEIPPAKPSSQVKEEVQAALGNQEQLIADIMNELSGMTDDAKSKIQTGAPVVTPGGSGKSPVVASIKKLTAEERKEAEKEAAEEKKNAPMKEFAQTIRVDLKRLDKLINLVGELVIAESMVFRELSTTLDNDNDLERKIHHLQRVSSELQDVAMSVRMVPLDATFKKMIRLIHDLSRKSGKRVDMRIVGEETEVDKNVIEQINDPIVHIIRNSVDHGIEPAEDRIKVGKPENGLVTLEARHDGGEVWISISDDGRGLNREKIIAKAIEKGLVNGDGSELADEEVFQLVFEPGFSTADKVTDISGRGVGMDVVKKNIEKLNGRIKIKSTTGVGTTISLRIPLTLAIIDGMLVKIGSSLFTIPILSIKESLRCNEEMVTTLPDGSECVTVREEQIPVMRLYKCFNRMTDIIDIDKGVLVIVEADGQKAALLIDEIVGQQEIVIKGLSGYLGTPKGISGCTVLGNGEVSLIIDTSSLLSRSHS